MPIGIDRNLHFDPAFGGFNGGSVTQPGAFFAKELSTGFYQPVSGQVALAIKGVQVALWAGATTGVGAQLFPDGTVGAPGIAFALDTDSGFYRIGANNIGVAVNGVKSLDISTTSVSVLDGLVATPGMSFYADLDTGFYRIGANNIGMALGGVKTGDFSATAAIWTQASADTDGFDLSLYKTRGTIAAPTVITTGDQLGQLNFAGYSGAGGYVTGAAIRATSTGTIGTTRVGAYLSFLTGTDAAPTVLTEQLRIDQWGNYGLNFGTMLTVPTTGTVRFLQLGKSGGVTMDSAATGYGFSDNTYFDGTNWKYATTAAVVGWTLGSGNFIVRTAASGSAGNTVTWVNQFAVLNSGTTGLNYTSLLNWPTTGTVRGVQLGAYGGFSVDSAATGTGWFDNAYFDGTNSKYATTAAASRIVLSAGSILLQYVASGTAGNTITWVGGVSLANSGVVTMAHYGAGTATFDASGNISSVSDERYKTAIQPFQRGLQDLLAIQPIRYHYNKLSGMDTEYEYTGFSAQNVSQSIPEAVFENKSGFYSFSDRPVLAAVVNAIQELNARLTKAGI